MNPANSVPANVMRNSQLHLSSFPDTNGHSMGPPNRRSMGPHSRTRSALHMGYDRPIQRPQFRAYHSGHTGTVDPQNVPNIQDLRPRRGSNHSVQSARSAHSTNGLHNLQRMGYTLPTNFGISTISSAPNLPLIDPVRYILNLLNSIHSVTL